jgi:hypothetical protein
MRFLSVLTLAGLAFLAVSGVGQPLPADCSAAAAATKPLEVSVKVFLCSAKGRTSTFDRTPSAEGSHAMGGFQVRVG